MKPNLSAHRWGTTKTEVIKLMSIIKKYSGSPEKKLTESEMQELEYKSRAPYFSDESDELAEGSCFHKNKYGEYARCNNCKHLKSDQKEVGVCLEKQPQPKGTHDDRVDETFLINTYCGCENKKIHPDRTLKTRPIPFARRCPMWEDMYI